MYNCEPKSSYDNVICAVDEFFNQWDLSTAILLEVCELQGSLC